MMRHQASFLLFLSLLQALLLIIAPVIKGWTITSTLERFTHRQKGKTSVSFSKGLGMQSRADVDDEGKGQSSSSLRVLGVCGGIGSGKSQACKILVSELGCVAHIDADSLAHVVYEPGSQAVQEIADLFGSEILQEESGEIDRKRLGGIVFNDRDAMSKLEHIVWPHVKTEIKKRIADLQENDQTTTTTSAPIVVLEAAMLLDAGWEDILDGLWVVTAPRPVALKRLVTDRGLSVEDAETRMDAQESRRGIGNLQEEIKKGTVTGLIENNGTLEDLTCALKDALADPSMWKITDASPKETHDSSS